MQNTRDMNHYGPSRITVLRQYCNGKFFVCSGIDFNGVGLREDYQEFFGYNNAVEYFNYIAANNTK